MKIFKASSFVAILIFYLSASVNYRLELEQLSPQSWKYGFIFCWEKSAAVIQFPSRETSGVKQQATKTLL